ncbi:MAG: hypothetical protein MJA83_02310, partial [Gammaproteobacteria bacterium]|nr:hypothetical protein [Gammaproteobacteria bacterium]
MNPQSVQTLQRRHAGGFAGVAARLRGFCSRLFLRKQVEAGSNARDMHAVRLPMAVAMLNKAFSGHGKVCAFVLVSALLAMPAAAMTPAGTVLTNQAEVNYNAPSSSVQLFSNTVDITTTMIRTPSTIEFLQAANDTTAGAESVQVGPTQCSADGGATFVDLPSPVLRQGKQINLNVEVLLVTANVYHSGDPIFVQVDDQDQNMDPALRETVDITLRVEPTGDEELIRLRETDVNTGVFVGHIQTTTATATVNNCLLSVGAENRVSALYQDQADTTDTSSIVVLVDPFGVVFNSRTGEPVSGARVSFINTDTGQPAQVFGDDGVSPFPSELITGGDATDASGAFYDFPVGEYRFPFAVPGNYRLVVEPPPGFSAPSEVAVDELQALPGAPFAIVQGSFGEIFVINPGPALHIDIPVDPVSEDLFVNKSVSRDSAAIGDFLQYFVEINNSNEFLSARDVEVIDTLPLGFRYQDGSLQIDDVKVDDPQISADGRTLTINLAEIAVNGTATVKYVVEVGAGARLGRNVNEAFAQAAGGEPSNVADAAVEVREDLFRSRNVLVGQVLIGECGATDASQVEGLGGVRIYLEDGSNVVTDVNGRYHFEGIRTGTHVLQVDLESLPEDYELVHCTDNTRSAGR